MSFYRTLSPPMTPLRNSSSSSTGLTNNNNNNNNNDNVNDSVNDSTECEKSSSIPSSSELSPLSGDHPSSRETAPPAAVGRDAWTGVSGTTGGGNLGGGGGGSAVTAGVADHTRPETHPCSPRLGSTSVDDANHPMPFPSYYSTFSAFPTVGDQSAEVQLDSHSPTSPRPFSEGAADSPSAHGGHVERGGQADQQPSSMAPPHQQQATPQRAAKPKSKWISPRPCEHGKRRTQCLFCYDQGTGGGSICQHRKRKDGCSACKEARGKGSVEASASSKAGDSADRKSGLVVPLASSSGASSPMSISSSLASESRPTKPSSSVLVAATSHKGFTSSAGGWTRAPPGPQTPLRAPSEERSFPTTSRASLTSTSSSGDGHNLRPAPLASSIPSLPSNSSLSNSSVSAAALPPWRYHGRPARLSHPSASHDTVRAVPSGEFGERRSLFSAPPLRDHRFRGQHHPYHRPHLAPTQAVAPRIHYPYRPLFTPPQPQQQAHYAAAQQQFRRSAAPLAQPTPAFRAADASRDPRLYAPARLAPPPPPPLQLPPHPYNFYHHHHHHLSPHPAPPPPTTATATTATTTTTSTVAVVPPAPLSPSPAPPTQQQVFRGGAGGSATAPARQPPASAAAPATRQSTPSSSSASASSAPSSSSSSSNPFSIDALIN